MLVSEIHTYLEAVFGDAEGQAHIMIGAGGNYDRGKYQFASTSQSSFSWPDEQDQLVRALLQESATGADVFVCPYLMHGDRRAKGAAVARRLVHADIDGDLDPAKVTILGGFAVASGTGRHGHAYVALDASVTAVQHQTLCRGLGVFLGDADAKISDNDLLRPPGTMNQKATAKGGEPSPVRWLVQPSGKTWAPADLSKFLSVDLAARATPKDPAAGLTGQQREGLPQKVRDALANVSGDRSTDTMRIVGACIDDGLDLGTTRAVVADRADLAERLQDRTDDDVWACWSKVTTERADKLLRAAKGDPFTDVTIPHQPNDPHAEFGDERQMELTAAARIRPRPVVWLWSGRLALGTLALLAGREGLGKSTLAYWLAARITRGELPGKFEGQPRAVLVCATEDSWSHTIVPRLIAAGADLELVYRVEVSNALGIHVGLSLPRDLIALERNAKDVGAAMLLLDPLMSRLPDLDTHRDAEVRLALEPLVSVADRSNMCVLGLIHHNKSGSTDPLQLVMGSKAFTAVARSVHTVVPDPEDETDTRRLFGSPKNNLGRTDLPTLAFTIGSYAVDTDEGTAWTGQLVWGDEVAGSIAEVMRRAAETTEDRTAAGEAAEWLMDYLSQQGGTAASKDVKAAGKREGHSEGSLKRASKRLSVAVTSEGFPRRTMWSLATVGATTENASSQVSASRLTVGSSALRGDDLTGLTGPTGGDRVQSVQSEQDVGSRAPTGAPTGRFRPCPRCGEPFGTDLGSHTAPGTPGRCDECGRVRAVAS